MKILVSGASGLIGHALVLWLTQHGHAVTPLRRSAQGAIDPWWDWERELIGWGAAGPWDAVIHLAGENLGRRWTADRKARIYYSRVAGTRFLSGKIAELPQLPKMFLSASAVGIYGSRGEEWLDEQSDSGQGFLAGICREWEAATWAAQNKGVRIVQMRFGLVLAPDGGALARMLPVFKWGLGGKIGDGNQFWSWISIADLVRAIEHLLLQEEITGPVNIVSPQPARNVEFTRALGRALGRPVFFPVPRSMLLLLFGEMARETMLSSARVNPRCLEKTGFKFEFPELNAALRHLVAK